MELVPCITCGKNKSLLQCEICACSVCKNCADFLAEETFSLMKVIPEKLKHVVYCQSCYSEHVEFPLTEYNKVVELAKEVMIFTKSQAKETRLVKRDQDPIQITTCPDYNEVLMRMAFQAVQLNCNAVIDVDIRGEKVRNGAYQTQVFSGSGIPAHVKTDQLVKDRSIWSFPN